MTISTQTRTAGPFAGTGLIVVYPFSFKVFQASDVLAVKVDAAGNVSNWVLSIDYTVSLNADQNTSPGGTLTPIMALTSGSSLTLTSNVSTTQNASLTNAGGFFPKTIEDALDRLTIVQQQQGGNLRVPEPGNLVLLPSALNRANKTLGFDSIGNPTVLTPVAGTAASVLTLLADRSSAANGSGLTGIDLTLNYVAGTIGYFCIADCINVMRFLSDAQKADVLAKIYTLDTYAVVQACLNMGQSIGRSVYMPGGGWRINQGLTKTTSIGLFGDGPEATIIKIVSAAATAALTVAVPDNSHYLGRIERIGFDGTGGAATCDGLVLTTTATNSVINLSRFANLDFKNVRDGIRIDGVYYHNTIDNVRVVGCTRYGIYSDSAFQLVYNTFSNIEVTGTAAAAYSFWVHSLASEFSNIMVDGCSYYASAGGNVTGHRIETIFAATVPSTHAVWLNQCSSFKGAFFTSVPASKLTDLIRVTGNSSIDAVHVADAGAGNQPDRFIALDSGSRGVMTNVKYDRAIVSKLESYLSVAKLNGWTISSCQDITATRGLDPARDVFTVTFPSGWTTLPTIDAATYRIINGQAFYNIQGHDGVCTAGASLGGLPFTALELTALAGACSDTTKRISASALNGTTTLTNIPANTLTGTFWQISGWVNVL